MKTQLVGGSDEREHRPGRRRAPCGGIGEHTLKIGDLRRMYVATCLQAEDAFMASITLTSRQFNQDTSRAKRAAADGPVFITDRGAPAHVLMTIEEYRRLTAGASEPETAETQSLADMLAMDGDVSDAFDEILEEVREQLRRETPRPIDLG
jgi:prevent-host-death family protein